MSERASYQRCVETLELTRLTDKANQRAGKLTLLNRKRLELARALAGDPTVLLLDEIAGGLTEAEVEELIVDRPRPARRGHLDHLDRAHRARVAGRGRPHLRHQLRPQDRRRRAARRSCVATRCRPATWAARRYEHPRAARCRRLLRRLPGALLDIARRSRRGRRSPSSAPTAPASRRCSGRSPAFCDRVPDRSCSRAKSVDHVRAHDRVSMGISLVPGGTARLPQPHASTRTCRSAPTGVARATGTSSRSTSSSRCSNRCRGDNRRACRAANSRRSPSAGR